MTPTPQFGLNIDPTTTEIDETFNRARLAAETGLELVAMQDHPYNRRFLDTWTFLTAVAMRVERVRVLTNVANLPLRPPAMLAKAAATLDVLTGGRVELGLGAGAFWTGIGAMGGPVREPGEAYAAFRDALHIIRGLWENPGRGFSYEGKVYSVRGAQFGPPPAHRIPIWVGALGPRMLRLAGQMADGVIVSSSYVTPQRILALNRQIDDGAAEAGRSPDAIRRGYNIMGVIAASNQTLRPAGLDDIALYGSAAEWIDRLTGLYHEYRQDTFIYWPVGEDGLGQARRFAEEVVPAVRQALAVATQAGR